ncbi:kyphoscoliosis peptidase-like [Megalops cyprinoides]|uniref:kyphoscoliosis peptidase-like n=1 Tax=Megalops cyprinoides TaxID=118141 RepID=UPI001863CF4C|nr:kyphoscoliosis peptidase-like [Megalops cyprinoides]
MPHYGCCASESKNDDDDLEHKPGRTGKAKADAVDGFSDLAFPWDRSNLKSMCIDLDSFKHIDAYASKVRTRDSVEVLVQELLKGTKSDVEKLRAIWIWVTHHIEYDVVGFKNPGLRSGDPSDVLKTGKGVCAGYAGLFQSMCSVAGIECQEVSGYSKGGMYKLGARFSGDATHAWNAVRLDGKWHLLDSTWGAGNVSDNYSTFKFEYNEFYFLTHPALFVADHFPLEGKWQLLTPQVSLKHFENSVRLRSAFYNLGLLSIHPETNIIQSDGNTTITVKSSSPVLFMHNLNGEQRDGLMTLTPDGMKLDIYPQQTGKHSLVIYAKASSSGDEGKYSHVCEYQFQCKAASRDMSIPEELSNPVGPSWLTERKGLSQPSQCSPVVHTSDGRCSFSFQVAGHLDVMATLSTASFSVPENELRRHIFQSRRGERVDFKVQLPRAGLYVFGVYGKDKAETGNYSFLCNYLISCTNPTVRWPVYPLAYTTWKKDYELVEPLAGVLPANREVQFKVRIPDVSMVSVRGRDMQDLVLDADGFWTGHCSTAGCTDLKVMITVNPGDQMYSSVLNYRVESH